MTTQQLANVTQLTAMPGVRTAPAMSVQAGFFNLESFELMQRVAKGFSSSTLVPKEYQGNVANTMIALSMAQRMGADPMMVMQNLYVVHGRPSWSSKFLIATFNACGRFSAMRFRFKGEEGKDDWACQAYATEKSTGNEIEGSWISIRLAKDEGWHGKNGSKWKTMPQHMLMYRAASFLVNVYAPELSMGLVTTEEANDIIDVTPTPAVIERPAIDSQPARARLMAQAAQQAAPVVTDPTPTAEEAAEVPEWPKANADGELVDVRGLPWIEGAHSDGKTCTADGQWRRKRGADPEIVERLEAQAAAKPEPEPAPLTLERILRGIAEAPDGDTVDEWVDLARDDLTVALTEADNARIGAAAKARWQELNASGEAE